MNKRLYYFLINLIIITGLIIVSTLLFSGCADTLKGDRFANQAPIVEFVNIPPDGQNFSRNPEIHWFGTDNDGQIDYYRYYVASLSDISTDPMTYILSIPDSEWVYIDVEPTVSDPQTTNIIPLKADSLNPVNNHVTQYVFVQAYDDRGLGSAIVYKELNRNDNPPETRIYSVAGLVPFVNSVFEGGVVTGVRLTWEGSDRRDYEEVGLIAPPFEYEWVLFGPFTDDDTASIYANYNNPVFVTEDARIFSIGDSLFQCDTSLVDDGNGNTVTEITCDTTVFTLNTPNSAFYRLDSLINVNNQFFNEKVVTNSSMESGGGDSWITNTTDTIFNVYRNGAPDSTVEQLFLFWIRSRDDAFVADLTPEISIFPVINPMYERQVLVIDFTSLTAPPYSKYAHLDTAKSYWYNTIHAWFDDFGIPEEEQIFDTTIVNSFLLASPDYVMEDKYSSGIPIATLLKHKIIILYNESYVSSGFASMTGGINRREILQAIDAGVNAWACWRAPIVGGLSGFNSVMEVNVSQEFSRYFGVNSTVYSAWLLHIFGNIPGVPPNTRIEDFVGTYSLNESQWQSLNIDTALLHQRLNWTRPPLTWNPNIAAYPEVNWSERSYGTEVMYLYKSKYGANHPYGFTYSFDGAPVGHRLRTSLFKTVHFNFSLLPIDNIQGQEIANDVLSWIYPADLSTSGANAVKENRYEDAEVKISIEEARELHQLRIEESQQLNGGSSE